MISQNLWNNFPLKKMTNSTDPKSTSSNTGDKGVPNHLSPMQLVGTVSAIAFAFLGFQWQLGQLVNNVSVQLTRSDLQIQELKEDVREIKLKLK